VGSAQTGRFALALALIFGAGCGGGGSSGPTPVPTPTPSTAPTPTPTPSASPTPILGCPAGNGDAQATCFRAQANFMEGVESAIDRLVQEHPEYFNLNDQASPGGYRVLNEDAYWEGVVRNLQSAGFCAAPDITRTVLQVKRSNDLSDEYDIITGNGFVRRGQGSYVTTCTPASFPVDPKEVIARVRVAFFSMTCQPPRTPPPDFITSGLLPVPCVGHVTASPKDKDGRDVDPRIHGPYIDWVLTGGAEVVHTEHWDSQPFNYSLYPRGPLGGYSFCATVQTVQGCLNGEVIP
jgi:hypothetical protein